VATLKSSIVERCRLYLHSKGHQITQGEMVSGRDAPEEGARKMAARRISEPVPCRQEDWSRRGCGIRAQRNAAPDSQKNTIV